MLCVCFLPTNVLGMIGWEKVRPGHIEESRGGRQTSSVQGWCKVWQDSINEKLIENEKVYKKCEKEVWRGGAKCDSRTSDALTADCPALSVCALHTFLHTFYSLFFALSGLCTPLINIFVEGGKFKQKVHRRDQAPLPNYLTLAIFIVVAVESPLDLPHKSEPFIWVGYIVEKEDRWKKSDRLASNLPINCVFF